MERATDDVTRSDVCYLSAADLSNRIERRALSPVDLVAALLDRIGRYNDLLHSYITVCADTALREAREAESEIVAGRWRGPLHGVPIAHKDIVFTRGVRTTCHSRTLLEFVPDADATVVRRLREAGMILLGKTNTNEFATGGTDIFGVPRNPWDTSRHTSGSSAGSGNAVAAGLAIAATGSDTGGSIRGPASFCGIVGIKPTYGRVSRHGVFPLSWSMDHVGPMARTVADCALLLRAMAGPDPLDPTASVRAVPDYTAGIGAGVRGLTLGVPAQHFYEQLDPEIDRVVRAALKRFEELGARLESVDLPRAAETNPAGRVLIAGEAFGLHAPRMRRRWAEYGRRARQRIAAGLFYTAAEYQQAAQIRALWCRELSQALSQVDAIVAPTMPCPAFTLEVEAAGPPPNVSRFTIPFNLTGHPALSVPCGFTAGGLPVGLQLIGKAFAEGILFRIGHAYEKHTEWHRRRPAGEGVA
jgi:aspartyl-tRNA(Asn)/glutamyl-tRNA(Gln) amidotransferase subunit A